MDSGKKRICGLDVASGLWLELGPGFLSLFGVWSDFIKLKTPDQWLSSCRKGHDSLSPVLVEYLHMHRTGRGCNAFLILSLTLFYPNSFHHC